MKNSFKYLILFLPLAILQSCKQDFVAPEPAIVINLADTVSFKAKILPILTSSCTTNSSCHASGGHVPDLTSGNAYGQLTNLGYVPVDDTSLAAAKSSILYAKIIATSKPMPPDGKLSADKIALILTWISQGSQNN